LKLKNIFLNTIAINIEHFEPRSVADIVESSSAIKRDFEKQLGRGDIPVFPINALVELHRSVGTKNSEEILGNWQVPRRQNLNDLLDQAFTDLIQTLRPLADSAEDGETSLLPIFLSHATESATSLLSRDRDFGISITQAQQIEIGRIARHMLNDESGRLKQRYQRTIDNLFTPSSELYRIVEEFLKLGSNAFLASHPYDVDNPTTLDPPRAYNYGSDQFLSEWLGLNLRLKDIVGPELITAIRQEIFQAAKVVIKFMENFLGTQCSISMLRALEFSNLCTDRFSENLNQLLATVPMPDFIEPILVHDFKRSAIFAEALTKNFWQKLVDRAKKEKRAETKIKPLTERCLLRTYEVHFNTAKEYYQLSLRSTQENYKFQYTYRLIDNSLQTLETVISGWVSQLFLEQESFTLRNQALINRGEREQIQAYLTWLMAT
jgi:hypothetical protein